MKKRLGYAMAAVTVTSVTALGSTGAATAAHCIDSGGPGNSDFAAHVKASNGAGGHNEGDHRGWSTCEENSSNFQQP
ncbi:MAG: hypothetical protein ACRDKX_05185 [Solirubrobacterales bacterium]